MLKNGYEKVIIAENKKRPCRILLHLLHRDVLLVTFTMLPWAPLLEFLHYTKNVRDH